MTIEIFIIMTLCLLIIFFLLFYIIEKRRCVKNSMKEIDIYFSNIVKNYDKHLKYLENLIKKMHTLNIKIDETYKKLKIQQQQDEYTYINFDTETQVNFEDSSKINLKEPQNGDKKNS